MHVVGFYQVNCYLLFPGNGEAVCVDPGDDAHLLLGSLERRGTRLAAILLTHAHWDHIGAVPDLAEGHGAPVMLHQGDLAFLDQWSPRPVRPARLLRDGDRVSAAGLSFRVLHTPGHTPGSLSFVLERPGLAGSGGSPGARDGAGAATASAEGATEAGAKEGVHLWVFTGDTLFRGTVGRTDFPGGSAEDLRLSLRTKLLALPDDAVVYPGHGEPTTIGRERVTNPFCLQAQR